MLAGLFFAGFASFVFSARAETSTEFQPLPVEVGETEIQLTMVSKAISSACSFGEINAIAEERKQGSRTFRLLLSIEPLEGSDFPTRLVDLSALDLKREFKTTMKLPRPEKEVYLHISLCSDWKNGSGCKGKPRSSLEEYFRGNDPKRKKVKLSQEPKTEEIFSTALLKITHEGAFIAQEEDLQTQAPDSAADEPALFVFSSGQKGLELTFRYRDRKRC